MGRVSDARERLVAAAIELIWLGSYGSISVDAICERAETKKGSFYHFFESKDALVIAALQAHWQSRKATLEKMFSVESPPLDRLTAYFENVYRVQRDLRTRFGRVVGCLHASIGSECIQQSPAISACVQETLNDYLRFYEVVLRQMKVEDAAKAARALFSYMEGVLAQARLQDDLSLVRELPRNAHKFLGLSRAGKSAGR